MPGGDRTGPMGFGPMTGRAAGFCAGYEIPGFAGPACGRGFGARRGGGGGRGWRNRFYATGQTGRQRSAFGWLPYAPPAATDPLPSAPTTTQEQQIGVLKAQSAYFESALESIRKRLEELATKERENQPSV